MLFFENLIGCELVPSLKRMNPISFLKCYYTGKNETFLSAQFRIIL